MKKRHSLLFFIAAAWYISYTEGLDCNSWFGPAGTVHCINSNRYNGYQWATCRSNAYIQQISKNKHVCRSRTATYCYYQCMIEVYNEARGDVYSRCSCSPFSPQPTEGVKLPSWCFSPSGTDCKWYNDCLTKAYPSCNENNDNDYAIKFSEKFCELSNQMNLNISDEGKRWVDGVRKCLQIKLVPLLGQTRVQTCGELKSNTFETHTPCYSKSPSLCSLSTLEQLKVFWTIKSEFPRQSFWPSLKDMLDEIGGCIRPSRSRVQEVRDNIEDKVKTETGKQEIEVRIKAWLEDPIPPIQLDIFIRDDDWPITERSYFAGKVVDALALNQKWKDVAFFAYFYENYSKTIRLFVADRSKYEMSGAYGKTSPTEPANITALLLQLSKDVNNTLNLQVNGKSVEIKTIHGCLDWDCHTLAFAVPSEADNGCDRSVGPAGATRCIKAYNFLRYQWATCRTNTYIGLKSNGRHKCTDSTKTYCYYECMKDVYNEKSGSVYSRCSCSPDSPPPNEDVKLPSWCYSPSGTDCTWYQDCLSKAYPSCSETDDNDHAVKFGEHFCEVFNETCRDLSDQGKRWIDGVRKCLQIKLVPLLGQTRVDTCRELNASTFETHEPCYLKPDQTSPLLCSLSTLEQLKVFWAIKSEFPGQTSWPSLKGMLDEIGGCIQAKTKSRLQEVRNNIEEKIKNDAERSEMEKIEGRINAWLENPVPPTQLQIFIRDRDWPSESGRSTFAGKVVNALALKQKWTEMALFSYYDEKTKSITLLMDDHALGNTSSTKPADIAALLLQLSKDVNSGNTLNLQVNGERVEIVTIQGCLDWKCNELAFAVTSQKPHKKYIKNVAESLKAMRTLSFAIFGFFIINFLFMA